GDRLLRRVLLPPVPGRRAPAPRAGLRRGPAARALLDRSDTGRGAARRDGGRHLRAEHRALEDRVLHPGELHHRRGGGALRVHDRIHRPQQLYVRRVADLRLHPAARGDRESLGRRPGDIGGDPAAGEAADPPGVPVPHLRHPGGAGAPLPAGGPFAASAAPPGRPHMSAPLLSCRGLTRRFGGLLALDGLDLSVEEGSVLGLIGPNGSGKTTFFNVLTGLFPASVGEVRFAGAAITDWKPQAVYRIGIARTFQRSRLCLPLSVFDNL